MKRIRDLVLFAVIVSLGSLFLFSCGTGGGGGGGSAYSVLGVLSGIQSSLYRRIAICKDGSVDLTNHFMPITGEVVSTATVTVTNDTIGTSEAASFSLAYNAYIVPNSFLMREGDRVSVRIEIDGDTITGDSTLIPNPFYSNLGPGGIQPFPYTASWTVSNTSFEASQTWFSILNMVTPEGFDAIVPIGTLSVAVPSSEVSAGQYYISVMGGNPMNLNGAASGSVIYTVGGVPDDNTVTLY